VYPAAVSLGASEKFAQTPAIREQSLLKKVAAVYGGDLREAEAILTAQALALNAIFTEVERDDAPRRKRMSDVGILLNCQVWIETMASSSSTNRSEMRSLQPCARNTIICLWNHKQS
jgi:hypothetical protein